MTKQTKHHYITQSYQENFSDETGKVWILTPEGKIFNTNPLNTFKEEHFFTVNFPDTGGATLDVETTLAKLEGHFKNVVRDKIQKKLAISTAERQIIAMFIGAMMVRTKIYRESVRGSFKKILFQGKELSKLPKKYLPLISSLSNDEDKAGISLDELEEGMENFDSYHSATVISSAIQNGPTIDRLNWCFLTTNKERGAFLCSDNPVAMCSPDRERKYGQNAIGALAGLEHSDMELSFPLTSEIALLAGYKLEKDQFYLEADKDLVVQINYRTIRRSNNIITNNREILETILNSNLK